MLKKWTQSLVMTAGLLLAGGSHAALTEGKDYSVLPQSRPVEVQGKQEVVEFFWYGCGHCYAIEPFVQSWAKKLPKDVNFRRVHIMWPGRADVEGHAKIFVALQAMGLDAKYQQSVFEAIQRDRIELRRDDVMSGWLKKQGINEAQFRSHYGSFSSSMALKKLEQLTRDYGVDGVPMFVVNGKYVTSPGMLGKEDDTITKALDELLAKDRVQAKKK